MQFGVVAALLADAAAGCGGALPVVTAGDAARSGVAFDELQRGRSLVGAKCSGCHRTPLPADHHTREWPRMLDEMSERANLDRGQRDAIQRYLVTMADPH
jgi:mono/diheme cytochrome c family protein